MDPDWILWFRRKEAAFIDVGQGRGGNGSQQTLTSWGMIDILERKSLRPILEISTLKRQIS
jgi:hypothetical protein